MEQLIFSVGKNNIFSRREKKIKLKMHNHDNFTVH